MFYVIIFFYSYHICGPNLIKFEHTHILQKIILSNSSTTPTTTDEMVAASKEAVVVSAAVSSDGGMSSIVYSALKRVAVVGVIYCVGYMNWSVAWLITPLIFSVMRDQWKKKSELSRSIAIASAQANEKDVILAKITDLPSWVYFPDVERCEWVNRVSLQHFEYCER